LGEEIDSRALPVENTPTAVQRNENIVAMDAHAGDAHKCGGDADQRQAGKQHKTRSSPAKESIFSRDPPTSGSFQHYAS
jgi:hypothetical protein